MTSKGRLPAHHWYLLCVIFTCDHYRGVLVFGISFEDNVRGGNMFRKSLTLILIASFLNLLFSSCSDRGIVEPQKKTSAVIHPVNPSQSGNLHNEILELFSQIHPLKPASLGKDEFVEDFKECANKALKNRGINTFISYFPHVEN